MGVAGLFAIVGYFCGLIEGGENQVVLAVCFSAIGVVASLLGYGSIAILIAGPDTLTRWLQRKMG
jgi:hypothetical protein